MKLSLFCIGALFFMLSSQEVICRQQTRVTCQAMEALVSGRSVEKAGETCTINEECTQFRCIGIADPNNNPPVQADTTYTFDPCSDPITMTVFATVSSLPDPVIDTVVNMSATVVLIPSALGDIVFILEPADDGVRFGLTLNEPGLPPGLVLFPETDIPLQCEPATLSTDSGDISLHHGGLILLPLLLVAVTQCRIF